MSLVISLGKHVAHYISEGEVHSPLSFPCCKYVDVLLENKLIFDSVGDTVISDNLHLSVDVVG